MAHEEQTNTDGWLSFSNWIDGHRAASEVTQSHDASASFRESLTSCSSNLERFQLVWDNKELRQEVFKFYRQDAARLAAKRSRGDLAKSAAQSKRMRDSGNEAFKKGRYSEALKRYTQAVRFASYPGETKDFDHQGGEGPASSDDVQPKDNSLALALANRSAALYALKKYRLCLLDIDLALKFKYPEENKFKLLIRKVKCLHILSVWANDVEQIKADLRAMLRSSTTKEYIKTELSNMFEFLDQTQPEDMDKDESDVEDDTAIKISNVSKSLPQAADCVEMSYEPSKGRYLLTNKDVSFGRMLLAEEPFVCNLAPGKRDQYCYNCFARLYSCGLACSTCTRVLYCSIDCLDSNKPIHSHECAHLLDFHEHLGVAYLVTHIMFKINFKLDEIAVHSRKTSELQGVDEVLKIAHSNWPDLVYKSDYASVLSLMDHAEDQQYDELMSYTLTAAYIVTALSELLKKPTETNDGPQALSSAITSASQQPLIGSLILRHLLQFQTNLISILDQNFQALVAVGQSIERASEKPIGVGLYPTIALLNHSCQPNVLSMFHRNKFIARASSGLDCGTEISYCYGPNIKSMSKKDRQRHLKQQYFFTCCCDACAQNREDHGRALVCPECAGPVIYNEDLTNKCMECKRDALVDVKAHLSKLDKLTRELEAVQAAEGQANANTLARVRSIEGQLAELVYWRNPIFVKVKAQLIEYAQEIEDLESALKYCHEELALSEKTFGANTIEWIMTKMKCVNLDWQRLYYKSEAARDDASKRAATGELRALASSATALRGKLRDLLNSTSILGAEATFDGELKFLSTLLANINKHLASLETLD